MGLVAGHVQWHPGSDALVGVVWKEMPEWPLSANQESNLFALMHKSNNDGYDFHLLMNPNHHHDSPRFSPDGSGLIWLENCLHSSTVPMFRPNTYEISSRLVYLEWRAVLEHAANGTVARASAVVVIGNSQNGFKGLDADFPNEEDDFPGLYPFRPLPARPFSLDGQVVFLTAVVRSEVKVLGVDVMTGQRHIHYNNQTIVLDVHQDVMLVKVASVSQLEIIIDCYIKCARAVFSLKSQKIKATVCLLSAEIIYGIVTCELFLFPCFGAQFNFSPFNCSRIRNSSN